MSEVRNQYFDILLTESEEKILDELMDRHDIGYSEIIGKALKVYYNLEKFIGLYEKQED